MKFAALYCLIIGVIEFLICFMTPEEPERSIHRGTAAILVGLALVASALIK